MLNEAVRTDIASSELCWLATVDADGTPNVSPKEIFAVQGDDRIVIADIASPVSVKNLRANPRACVSFVDIFRGRGFKMVSTASIIGLDEAEFVVVGADLLAMAGRIFRFDTSSRSASSA